MLSVSVSDRYAITLSETISVCFPNKPVHDMYPVCRTSLLFRQDTRNGNGPGHWRKKGAKLYVTPYF